MNKENRKKEEEEPTYTEKYYDDEYEYRYGSNAPCMRARMPPPCRPHPTETKAERLAGPGSPPSGWAYPPGHSHVFLPKRMVDKMPRNEKGELRLMTEDEWRDLGVTQSHGWEHYLVHTPEPHILLFRRELNYTALYGNVPRKVSMKAPAATGDVAKKQPLVETNAMMY